MTLKECRQSVKWTFFFKRNLRWPFLTFLTTSNLRSNFGLEQRPPVNNDHYHFAYTYVSQIRKTVISESKSPSERRSISPKRKWQLCWFFMLLGSACVKVCKILMKLTRGGGEERIRKVHKNCYVLFDWPLTFPFLQLIYLSLSRIRPLCFETKISMFT